MTSIVSNEIDALLQSTHEINKLNCIFQLELSFNLSTNHSKSIWIAVCFKFNYFTQMPIAASIWICFQINSCHVHSNLYLSHSLSIYLCRSFSFTLCLSLSRSQLCAFVYMSFQIWVCSRINPPQWPPIQSIYIVTTFNLITIIITSKYAIICVSGYWCFHIVIVAVWTMNGIDKDRCFQIG